jgi:hypothetical protein
LVADFSRRFEQPSEKVFAVDDGDLLLLAAGAIPPRSAFPHAINGGADFILVGMFDWQIEENVKLAKRVIEATARSTTSRTRPWYGSAT